MDVSPPRSLGLTLGVAILLAGLGAAALGLANLGSLSPALVLWGTLPVIGVAAAGVAAYRVHGLATARYLVTREGIGIRWGLAEEEIPLASARLARPAEAMRAQLRPGPGLRWPGCVVGHTTVEGVGPVEFFATRGPEHTLLVTSPERTLAISPPDPEAFLQAFAEAARLGPLDPIEPRSERPDLLPGRLWTDPAARVLILAGLAMPVLHLGVLGFHAGSLPETVPFGFDALGNPGALVAPGRLLLLPLIAVLAWSADLILGAAFYRRAADHWIAFSLWGTSIVLGALLLGAIVILIG